MDELLGFKVMEDGTIRILNGHNRLEAIKLTEEEKAEYDKKYLTPDEWEEFLNS